MFIKGLESKVKQTPTIIYFHMMRKVLFFSFQCVGILYYAIPKIFMNCTHKLIYTPKAIHFKCRRANKKLVTNYDKNIDNNIIR